MERDTKYFITYGAISILILVGVGIFSYYQWQECRSMGFSTFYCIKHIS